MWLGFPLVGLQTTATNGGNVPSTKLHERLEQIALTHKSPAQDEAAKAREAHRLELLSALAEIGGRATAEEDIIFRGTQIILPETMDLIGAITFQMEKVVEDEKEITYRRTYNYRPWDGAHATMAALRKAFGMVAQRGTPTFFGEKPPELLTIPISPTETAQVPWGGLGVIHMPGLTMYLGSEEHDEFGKVFTINASGPRKYRHEMEGIFTLIAEELRLHSIYRGKAFDGQTTPQFLDLNGVDPAQVIYADEVRTQLEANLWALIRHSEQMEAMGEALKRAVLLEGPYGCGKTLAAYLTAQIAQKHGWTFILCRPGRDDLFSVMATARLYEPAVVFMEDLDGVAQAEDDHVRKLLDIFDGIKAKGTRILMVLTTNHVENIHRGMMRPGRLDAVIHIGELDAAGIRKLIEVTVDPALLAPSIDWKAVTDSMTGYLPAFCREAIGRAKRYNLARNGGHLTPLGTDDFVNAATGLRPQLELMEGAKEGSTPDALTTSLTRVVENVVERNLHHATLVDLDGDPEFRLQLASANGVQG